MALVRGFTLGKVNQMRDRWASGLPAWLVDLERSRQQLRVNEEARLFNVLGLGYGSRFHRGGNHMATVRDTLRSPGTSDQQSLIVKRILGTLIEQNECSLEDLIEMCGAGSSNQVLVEVDRMYRIGEICLLYKKDGDFAVTLPRAC